MSCKVFGPNRTKMLHVKLFGTIRTAGNAPRLVGLRGSNGKGRLRALFGTAPPEKLIPQLPAVRASPWPRGLRRSSDRRAVIERRTLPRSSKPRSFTLTLSPSLTTSEVLATRPLSELRNMDETIFGAEEIHEGAEIHHFHDRAVVDLARFRLARDGLDPIDRGADRIGVGGGHLHRAVVLDIDFGAGFFDDLANDLAAGPDHFADLVGREFSWSRCAGANSPSSVARAVSALAISLKICSRPALA